MYWYATSLRWTRSREKAAIYSMNMMYEDENADAILLVDASNAFNLLNRQSFLHNISYLCPPIAIFVKNCYSTPSRLFLQEEQKLHERKGLLKVIQSQWRSMV